MDVDSFDFKMRRPEQVRRQWWRSWRSREKALFWCMISAAEAAPISWMNSRPAATITTIASYDALILKHMKMSGGGDSISLQSRSICAGL